jgi:hypothetical protein
MGKKSLVFVLIAVGFLVVAAFAVHRHGGGLLTRWLPALHAGRGH